MVFLLQVPETPHWLLSKKRTKHAEKSLRWLRGWTTKQAVAHEFHELQRHSERSNACYSCIKQDLHCSHPPPTIAEKYSELKRKQTIKPIVICCSLFFLYNFSGAITMRPFVKKYTVHSFGGKSIHEIFSRQIAQIFKAYESPIPTKMMMLLGVSDNLARVIFLCLVRFTGKRYFYLTTLFGIFISSFLISCYGFIYLPKGFVSFDLKNQTFHLENPHLAYIPVVLIFIWNFCSYCGFTTMPWMMLSYVLLILIHLFFH